jgi:hypothetical protein
VCITLEPGLKFNLGYPLSFRILSESRTRVAPESWDPLVLTPEIRHIFLSNLAIFFPTQKRKLFRMYGIFSKNSRNGKKKYRTYGKLYLFSEKIEVRKNGFFKK